MSLPPNDGTGVPPVPPVPPQPPVPPVPQPDAPQVPPAPEPPSFGYTPPAYEPPSYVPPAFDAAGDAAGGDGSAPPPLFDAEPGQEPIAAPETVAGPAQPGYASPEPVAPAYAAPGYPAPGYAAPAAPGYGANPSDPSFPGANPATQGYPGSVPPYASGGYPAGPYGGAPVPPPGPGKGLAIAALILGIIGLLGISVAFIPFAGFASILVPIVAVVLGVVALVKKKPGKGLAITGTVLGAVALIACTAIAIAMTTFITNVANDPGGFIDESCEAAGLTQEECDALKEESDTDPESGPVDDPADDPASEPGDAPASVEVGEVAFGPIADDPGSWWYAISVDQTDAKSMYEYFFFDVEALDANGRVLDTDPQSATLLPGTSVVVGEFYDFGDDVIKELNLVGLDDPANEKSALTDDLTGAFTFSDITPTTEYGMTTVTGNITSSFPVDQEGLFISLLVRDASGKTIGTGMSTTDRVPAGGSAKFEGYLMNALPEGATIEAFAQPY